MPHKNLDKWFYQLWQHYQNADEAYKTYDRDTNQKHGADFGGASSESWAKWTEMEKHELDNLKWLRKKTQERVLGHLGSFDHVRCWMVDVVGKAESEQCEEIVKEMIEGKQHEYVERFGAIAAEVRKVMSKFNLTDSGGGGGNWHLGCHCTEVEAQQLCRALTNRFGGALVKGFLHIERKPWSIRLVEEDM